MKKAVTLVGVMLLLLCIQSAYGQSWKTVARIDVPFEFVVGSTVLPAGTYAVRLDVQAQTLSLFNQDEGRSATSLVHDISPSSSAAAEFPTLIFDFDGHRHVLHQVTVSGDDRIHDLIHGAEVLELPATPST